MSRLSSLLPDARTRALAGLANRSGLVQISLTGILWGTTGVVVALVHDATGLSPTGIAFYRLSIAAVVLLALTASRLPRLFAALRAAPVALTLTGVGLGAYQAMYFLAVAEVGVTVATVVSLGLAPVLTTVWDAARARRMPRLPKLAILLAATTGLILVSASTAGPIDGSIGTGPNPVLGLLAAVGSGTSYAATTLLSRRISQDMASLDLTAVSTTVGALTLAPASLMLGISFAPSLSSVGWLAYLGVVTTALAYALFYSGLKTTTGSVAAVLTLLEPLTAALLAVMVLHEPLSARTLLGGLLMLSAVVALYLAPDVIAPGASSDGTGGSPITSGDRSPGLARALW